MKRAVLILGVTFFAVFFLFGAVWAQNTVKFNVDMNQQVTLGNFDPAANDTVCLRGDTTPLEWSGFANILTEGAVTDTIYDVTLDFGSFTGTVEYKFVIRQSGSAVDNWESISNRTVDVVSGHTDLDTVYFNDEEPAEPVEGCVIFCVDMSVQRFCGFFGPDTNVLTVRGGTPPLAWDYPTCLPEMIEVIGKPDTFCVVDTFFIPRGDTVQYKYQFSKQPDDGAYGGTWEACVTECIGGNFFFVYDPPALPDCQIIPIRYFSEITPEDMLAQDVAVTWQVDMTAAREMLADSGFWYFDGMVGDTVYSIDSLYLAGSAMSPPLLWTWDEALYPDTLRMYDDGTHGDLVGGDDIWSRTLTHPVCSPKSIEHKYGINGEDNDMGFGVNRFTLVDDSGPTFLASVECFGSPTCPPKFVRGDVDASGSYTLGDGLYFLGFFFTGSPVPPCEDAADVDDGGTHTLGDGLYFLNFFFTGSPPIPPPSGSAPGDCGVDPTPDDLGCLSFPPCGTKAKVIASAPLVSVKGAKDKVIVRDTEVKDGEVVVSVELVNVEDITGVDIALSYDASILEAEKVEGGTDYDYFVGYTGDAGKVRIGVVPDFEMKDAIGAGERVIATMVFKVKGSLGDGVKISVERADLYGHGVKQVRSEWIGGLVKGGTGLPTEFALSQNYPNPFNPTTLIKYDLPVDCQVRLEVYNVVGQRVTTLVDGHQKAGYKMVTWNAQDLASGVYFYKLTAGKFTSIRKMVLLK